MKIIKKNKYLNKKLDISIIDYKKYFFQKKIEYYGYYRIKDYYEELKNYLNNIILNEEELNDLLSYCLSKNEYFNLSISDEQFDFIFKNSYFEENMRIDIDYLNEEYIPKNVLIKDNTLTNRFVEVLKECFSLYSNYERMNKFQVSKFMSKVSKKEIHENNEKIIDLFLNYDFDNDGLLSFEGLCQYYFDLIKKKEINVIWDNLYSLGYNNLLEKEINLDYFINNLDEFEDKNKNIFINLFKISNKRIYKLYMVPNIDEIFIIFLNNNHIFENLEKIDISIINLEKMISLNIIFPKIEELNLYINTENFDCNGLNNIFLNVKILNIYIENNLNLIDLFENIKNDNIERLGIFIIDDIQLKIECQIILENIRIVEIRINRFNNILFKLFEYIQFPNLNEYILNINDYISQNEILKTEESDFNIINKLIFKKK